MTEFVSGIKEVAYSPETVFAALSDLSKLEKVRDRIPEDKIADFTFSADHCSFSVSPVGKVKFVVVEREPSKTVKFASEGVPFQLNLWVQIKEKSPEASYLRLTVRADLNAFLKPLVSKPLTEGLDKMVDLLASLPYDRI